MMRERRREDRMWPSSCDECDVGPAFPCDSCPVSVDVRMADDLCGEVRALDGGVEVPLPLLVPLGGLVGTVAGPLADVPWSLVSLVRQARKRDGARLW